MKALSYFLFFLLISCGTEPLFSVKSESKNKNTTLEALTSSDEFELSNLQGRVEWRSEISTSSEGILEIRFWDADTGSSFGPYLPVENLCLFLWMIMPDGSEHGSAPVTITAQEHQDGVIYFVSDIYFIMPGTWEIHLGIKNQKESCPLAPGSLVESLRWQLEV